MNPEEIFLHILIQHQSDFEEARELYDDAGEFYGMSALDRLCDTHDLEGDLEDLAESYIRGEYDPLD